MRALPNSKNSKRTLFIYGGFGYKKWRKNRYGMGVPKTGIGMGTDRVQEYHTNPAPYPNPIFFKKNSGVEASRLWWKKGPNLYLNTYCALRFSWQLRYSYAPTNLIFWTDSMHFNYEYYFLNLINPTCIILVLNMYAEI